MASTITSYNTSTALQVRSVRELVDMIDFKDAPLLKMLGISNQGKFRLRDFPRIKYEWFEDTMPPRSTTLNEGGTLNNSDLTFTVTAGTYFKKGDVLKIEDELMVVSSVSSNDITVLARGYSGSNAATHADGSTVTKVGVARLEGEAYTISYTTTVSNPYNYTQILEESLEVTRSELIDSKYAIDDILAYHLQKIISDGKRAGSLPISLEQSFYHGLREVGSATVPRMMGGFNEFVTSHLYDLNGVSLTLPDITTAMRDCFDDGGRPQTLIVNSFAKMKISEFFKGTIRTERDERMGGAVIDKIVTDFGEIDVVWDWLCPANEMYLIDRNKMGWVEFRPFELQDVSVTTDSVVKRVIGEYGFVLLNESAHAKIYDFSVTA